ncbi:hypothetical protein [Streptomyces tsukubensis]|uniref:Integral membrane protein n=1 Tax=Streptomyces tsukubensis TaxID=83656 RepID=A0A1V4A7I4_9ACTN|nr:hypothetical protein [Streptomyces tsukubensis]OON77740.1 hypothetical protein B1H18_18440 [Streptomyces tsukubensis]QFR93210.1 hypothetical protein GBW32_09075 [Streptomyces tsukubensis]
MGGWLERNFVEPGKLPLLLALVSFVVTFLVTRVIVRLIRAGRGPFRDITPGGIHIHHVVPGVVLTVIGGFGAVGSGKHGVAAGVCAVVFGAGVGLVLDEFALILHLDDVYWSEEGRQSVEVVILTAALVTALLAGFSPIGVDTVSSYEERGRAVAMLLVAADLGFVGVALLKGKLRLALIGVLVPLVAPVGAVRLAKPNSPWARRRYATRPRRRARALVRAYHHDRRWVRYSRRFQDFIAGAPDPRTPLPPTGG